MSGVFCAMMRLPGPRLARAWRAAMTAFVASLFALARAEAPGQTSAPAAPKDAPVVLLPPMIVEEKGSSVRWFYGRAGDREYLSRCSSSETEDFIRAHSRALHRLRVLVPEAYLADLPSITILSDQVRADDPVAVEWRGQERRVGDAAATFVSRVRYMPNLGLEGRDVSVVYSSLERADLNLDYLSIASRHLRVRLERCTPMLPPWLIEGVLALHRSIDVRERPVTLRPLLWLTPEISRALARDPTRPRVLLPASELFAPDALRDEGNHDPQRVAVLHAQVGLFLRWGLDPQNGMRERLWTFAEGACARDVDQALFTRCFGFDFAELRDRMSDYLPHAVRAPLVLEPGPEPEPGRIEVREASALEIARLRGEWERLVIDYVGKRNPDHLLRYVAQARSTLRRAVETVGARDAGLLAQMGLCEIEAGDEIAAAPMLQAAVDAGGTRPLACFELARLRFGALAKAGQLARPLSAGEVEHVARPLRLAALRLPALPEVFGMLADLSLRSDAPPSRADVELLLRGAKQFALNASVSLRIAAALGRGGRPAEARALLERAAPYAADEALRARYAALRQALAGKS